MATIYYDESSRGYHGNAGRTPYTRGRWVGEKTVNGKRIRMRSTDYDKVLAWMNGEKTVRKGLPLKGLPTYTIDIERREVYGRGGIVKKGRTERHMVTYVISKDGVKYHVSFNRLAYAALHDLDVLMIPGDLSVEERDGEYVLTYLGDMFSKRWQQQRTKRRSMIANTLSKRKHEIEILERYYRTLDTTELVTYATQQCFGSVLRNVMKDRCCTIQHAKDVVLEATELYLHRVTEQDVPVIDISGTIRSLCAQTLRNNRNNKMYNDNLKRKKL